MNTHSVFIAVATLAVAVSSSPAFTLETTAGNHDLDSLSRFNDRLEAYQALLTAALNELTRRIDVCTASGKLYGPTHPAKDANSCVALSTSSTLPDPTHCDPGAPLISTGGTWTCAKTFTNPKKTGVYNIRDTAASGAKWCAEQGYTSMYASTSGASGCNSCFYAAWTTTWVVTNGCNGCRPFTSLTCY